MLKFIHDAIDTIISYFAAVLALAATLPLMKIGGAVLLIARLIVDIPPAYAKVKEFINK